jgi:hypothetical protein
MNILHAVQTAALLDGGTYLLFHVVLISSNLMCSLNILISMFGHRRIAGVWLTMAAARFCTLNLEGMPACLQ